LSLVASSCGFFLSLLLVAGFWWPGGVGLVWGPWGGCKPAIAAGPTVLGFPLAVHRVRGVGACRYIELKTSPTPDKTDLLTSTSTYPFVRPSTCASALLPVPPPIHLSTCPSARPLHAPLASASRAPGGQNKPRPQKKDVGRAKRPHAPRPQAPQEGRRLVKRKAPTLVQKEHAPWGVWGARPPNIKRSGAGKAPSADHTPPIRVAPTGFEPALPP
jgi:hypothetical protein